MWIILYIKLNFCIFFLIISHLWKKMVNNYQVPREVGRINLIVVGSKFLETNKIKHFSNTCFIPTLLADIWKCRLWYIISIIMPWKCVRIKVPITTFIFLKMSMSLHHIFQKRLLSGYKKKPHLLYLVKEVIQSMKNY